LSACGSDQASTAPTATPPVSARQAAKRYFAAMTPVFEQDYREGKEFEAAGKQWKKEAERLGPSLTVWQDFAGLLMSYVPKEQRILAAYEAIQPPPAFRKAHEALVAENDSDLAAVDEIIHDINTLRTPPQFMNAFRHLAKGTVRGKRIVREFRKAAAKVHLRVPAKLVEVYAD
ncbi:MAG TPA: hypothetical protein VK576_09760, partial [Thermoleophilia bacterium]|nr:hypothetical protein [Thermoleophilia bacterium]